MLLHSCSHLCRAANNHDVRPPSVMFDCMCINSIVCVLHVYVQA
jgi:hypothetical protein